MSRQPEISIIMTAYNTAAFVAEAIESVVRQRTTFRWELLFVDDGSRDETLAIARAYRDLLPDQIFVFTHEACQNRGISASRNLALRHARGPLLTFLDSDDLWLPHALQTQATLLKSHPEVTMTYAEAERWVDFDRAFDEKAARAARWGENYLPALLPQTQAAGLLPRGALLPWTRADESLVPCICTVMLRTSAARAVGGFCDEFRGVYDDQAFHAKIASRFDIFAQEVCVARYRQHASSCCARARLDPKGEAQERKRFEQFLVSTCGHDPQSASDIADGQAQLVGPSTSESRQTAL